MASDTSKYIITVDGVSGAGKSSTAKKAALALDILFIDTGAMYRGVALACLQKGIQSTQVSQVIELTKTLQFDFTDEGTLLLNGKDVSKEIRHPEVNNQVSDFCAIPQVRQHLVNLQRNVGNSRSSIVEGRDIGTVVFPEADFKFFLWADPAIRAERRLKELVAKGINITYDQVIKNIEDRDNKDSTREHSPLKQAEDAIRIDTTNLTLEEQVQCIVELVSDTFPK